MQAEFPSIAGLYLSISAVVTCSAITWRRVAMAGAPAPRWWVACCCGRAPQRSDRVERQGSWANHGTQDLPSTPIFSRASTAARGSPGKSGAVKARIVENPRRSLPGRSLGKVKALAGHVTVMLYGLGVWVVFPRKTRVSPRHRDAERNIDPHGSIPLIAQFRPVQEDPVYQHQGVRCQLDGPCIDRPVFVNVPHGRGNGVPSSKWRDDTATKSVVVVGGAIEALRASASCIPAGTRVVEVVHAHVDDRPRAPGRHECHQLPRQNRFSCAVETVNGHQSGTPRCNGAQTFGQEREGLVTIHAMSLSATPRGPIDVDGGLAQQRSCGPGH